MLEVTRGCGFGTKLQAAGAQCGLDGIEHTFFFSAAFNHMYLPPKFLFSELSLVDRKMR